MEKLMANLQEATEACLSADVNKPEFTVKDNALEIVD